MKPVIYARYYIWLVMLGAMLLTASCSSKLKLEKTSPREAALVEAVWKKYVKALASKNKATLSRMSLSEVYCSTCSMPAGTDNSFLPFSEFLKQTLPVLPKSKLWAAIKTGKYEVLTEKISHYQYKHVAVNADGSLEIYDIWYSVYGDKKNGHEENRRYAFQFVKQGGQYKFFGLTAVAAE